MSLVPSLDELASKYGASIGAGGEIVPSGVAITSAFVKPGYLFIAAQGTNAHGIDFLDEAISQGATAVLTDRQSGYSVPALIHPDPRSIAGLIAKEIFGSQNVALTAITGTNGKTSTAFFLRRLLEALGEQSGLITSHQQFVGAEVFDSELTTPEAPRLHELIQKMSQAGQRRAVIEVSAQALTRNRVQGLRFKIAAFTNLSRDHLDDYGSMDRYLSAKAELFTAELSELAVINCEDEWGKELFESIQIPKVGIGDGLDYQLELFERGFRVSGKAELAATLDISGPMAKNLALASVLAIESGYEPVAVESALDTIDFQVPGRLEEVVEGSKVYVDYAHTPGGVEASVQHLISKHGELVVVLGASGNRDQGKREEMAQACKGVTRLFVTDQHPRNEDPASIRRQLLSAAVASNIEAVEAPDPAAAISDAVNFAAGRAVLWCGPGALKYREVAGKKVPFDARKLAREALEK